MRQHDFEWQDGSDVSQANILLRLSLGSYSFQFNIAPCELFTSSIMRHLPLWLARASRNVQPVQFQRRTLSSVIDSPIKVKYQPAPHSGNIRILLLDRPEARNALSRNLVADLKHHVDEIQAEGGSGPTRALILASNTDKAFCAGADLKERKGMTQEEYAGNK